MSRYTGNGDRGTTELVQMKNVSKSDDRVNLIGTIEELSSHLGVLKTETDDPGMIGLLESIQKDLCVICDGVTDPYSKDGKLKQEATSMLEQEIQHYEEQFTYPVQEGMPGKTRLSARIDLARSVARRAERVYAAVSIKFGADAGGRRYLNRLSDLLYTMARFVEEKHTPSQGKPEFTESERFEEELSEKVVREVLRQMGIQGRITLDVAKQLVEEVEAEATRQGKKAVIAVCGPDGNPVAVHVMDGAYLVSFDVAVKKAYTAVAVKMSTMELNALAQPGGTFYGLDKLEGGNIIIFGGGIPLTVNDTIIGGLGISGGTGEEDHALAMYGLSVLKKIMKH